jgi:hypothetical protein
LAGLLGLRRCPAQVGPRVLDGGPQAGASGMRAP